MKLSLNYCHSVLISVSVNHSSSRIRGWRSGGRTERALAGQDRGSPTVSQWHVFICFESSISVRGAVYIESYLLSLFLFLSVSESVMELSRVRDLFLQLGAFFLFTFSPPSYFLVHKLLSLGSKTRQKHREPRPASRTEQHRALTWTTQRTAWHDPLESGAAQFIQYVQPGGQWDVNQFEPHGAPKCSQPSE